MIRYAALFAVLLSLGTAEAQQLNIIKIADNAYFAYEISADGTYKHIGNYKTLNILNPTPPPSPTHWAVTGGLHMIIVDNENERGRLPQSQINIFTSTPLREWLNANIVTYRYSSNDLSAEARKLEQPKFVQGWDLLMKSNTPLPAWIISNGQQTAIGPLPKTVNDIITQLERFK